MDKIEKLIRKLSKKDREHLLSVIERLISGNTRGLSVQKVKNSDFYRLRTRKFRIIFHREKNHTAVIDHIRLRNERTYKDI